MNTDVKLLYIEELPMPFTGTCITGTPIYDESGVDDYMWHQLLLPDESDPVMPFINYKSKRWL